MPEDIRLKHIRSDGFRIVVSDNAICSMVADQFGARITMTLTKMAISSSSEAAVREDDGGIRTLSGSNVESEVYRSLEVAADLRPDHALNVANQLLETLKGLPAALKQQYGIPDGVAQYVRPNGA